MAVAVLPLPGSATEMRHGTNVSIPAGEIVNDDLLIAGGTVNFTADTPKDLMALGNSVVISGHVGHNAFLLGSMIDTNGRIDDDLIAAGNIRLGGNVGGSASLAGGTVIVINTANVAGNLNIAGGTVVIDGTVAQDLSVTGGQLTINGVVGRNVSARVGSLSLGPKAVIRGNLIYTSQRMADIPAGARVLGKTLYTHAPWRHHQRHHGVGILWVLCRLIALYALGAIALAVMPRATEEVSDRVLRAPWKSLGIGFLLWAAIPILALLVFVTLVGIPIALILMGIYLITLYISRIFFGLAIGKWILARGERHPSPYLELLVGLVILVVVTVILWFVPIIGWLINLGILLTGFGALWFERYQLTRQLKAEGRL
jgi:hypothetical protein